MSHVNGPFKISRVIFSHHNSIVIRILMIRPIRFYLITFSLRYTGLPSLGAAHTKIGDGSGMW